MVAHAQDATPLTNDIGSPKRELLWPDGAPGAKADGHNDQPAITIYRAPADTNIGTAVVICPGGGYGHLAMGHEGTDIAKWFNAMGVTAFVLEYRMSKGGYRHPIPLHDAQRAIRTVRSRANELHIAPDRIGIIGFSAGGHLASTAGTHFDSGDASAADQIDRLGCRPDFMILCYPVIAFGESFTHKGSQRNLIGKDASPELIESLSNEKQVTQETPPTFLFHTDADSGVQSENSVAFYLALRKAKVPAELHIFEKGRHGVGLARNIPATRQWPTACKNWLKARGLLDPPVVAKSHLSYEPTEKAASQFRVGQIHTGLPEGLNESVLTDQLDLPADTKKLFGWFTYGDRHSRSIAVLRTEEQPQYLLVDLNRDKRFSKNEQLRALNGNATWELMLDAEFVENFDQFKHQPQKVRISWNRTSQQLELLTLGAMVGTATIDGESRAAKYLDHNSNGSWFDLEDRFLLDVDGDGKLNAITERFACQTVCQIDRKQYTIGGSGTGSRMSLDEITARGTITPTVALSGNAEIVEVAASLASGSGVHVRIEKAGQPISCPVGIYHVESLRIKLKGEGQVYEFKFAALPSNSTGIALTANGNIELDLLGKLTLSAVRLVNHQDNIATLTISPLLKTSSGLYLIGSKTGESDAVTENRLVARSFYLNDEIDLGTSGFS